MGLGFKRVGVDRAIQRSAASWKSSASRLAGPAFIVALAALLLSACSSSSDSEQAKPAAPVELANFCTEWARAACTGIQNCCTNTARKYPDAAACNAAQTTRCNTDYFPALSGGQYTYDAAAAGELVARVSRSTSACGEPDGQITFASVLGPALPPGAPCSLITGKIAANPCLSSFCKPTADGASASCALTPAQGELCPDLICAAGLACSKPPNASASTSTCQPIAAAASGASCSGQKALCAPDQVCRYTDAGIAGFFKGGEYPTTYQCLAQLPNGALALDPYTCKSGLIHDGETSGVCVACRSSSDCYQVPHSTVINGFDSIDNYSGYCDAGVCHEGLENPPLGAKPKGSVCFDDTECRSQECTGDSPETYGFCGAPNLELLFCTSP